jgi:hypothetical protein
MNGIELNHSYDNPREQPVMTSGTVDISEAYPTELPIRIAVGYKYPELIITTVNNLDEFKNAIIDAVITVENKRLAEHEKILHDNELTPAERAFIDTEIASGKRFHEIIFPPEQLKKQQRYGNAKKQFRFKPKFNVVLSRPMFGKPDGSRVFIKCAPVNGHMVDGWHWTGWNNISEINFSRLYKMALATEQHCRNLDALCGAITGTVKTITEDEIL